MKKRVWLALVFNILLMSGCNITEGNRELDIRLQGYLDQKQYFKLNEVLQAEGRDLSPDRLLYYQAWCNNLFDRTELSNSQVEELFSRYDKLLNDSIRMGLLDLKGANHIRLYQYADAGKAYQAVLDNYAYLLDSTERASYENVIGLWAALGDVGPQRIHKNGDVEIAASRDRYNYLNVPVEYKGVESEFIFDTGANLSIITESVAREMQLTIYEVDVEMATSTELKVNSRLAVADEFRLGDLLFENVVFLLMPDDMMSFPEVGLYIKGVVGFPLIHQMGELHLYKDGKIVLPEKSTPRAFRNLALKELHPYVQVLSDNDTLIFCLDTGAKSTDLSFRYYTDHKEQVEANGEEVTGMRGGAGGMVEQATFNLKDFSFTIGSRSGVLEKVKVVTTDYAFMENSDGNLGQDIFFQFDKMILNFKEMFLDFE